MRAFMIAIVAVVALAGTAQAATVKDVLQAVEAYDPIGVIVMDGRATVMMSDQSVEQDAFNMMIVEGICAAAKTNPMLVDGIREFAFVNRWAGQGWVFDDQAGGCASVNAAENAEKRKMQVLFGTRVH